MYLYPLSMRDFPIFVIGVAHDDKECFLWLSSKGSLKVDNQQFGHWIQAAQFNTTRKSIMDVKGFGKKDTQCLSGASSITGTSSSSEHQRTVSLKPVSDSTVGTTTGAVSKTVMELVSVGIGGQCEPDYSDFKGTYT